jgi:NAD(P)-dependent dehydrogenase (short-subunit alcohol dehydrogenase family)
VDAAFDKIEKQSAAAVLVVASGGLIVDPTAVPNVATLSTSDWDRTVALNLSGVFFCIRKFVQLRLAKPVEHGRIIVIGSGVGQIAGSPTDLGYVSSKAAIIGLVRQVAFDLAPSGITVNTVAPGPVGTPEFLRKTNAAIQQFVAGTTLMKRLGEPDEVAAGVAYLASHDASYVTGTTLDINGGVHMH